MDGQQHHQQQQPHHYQHQQAPQQLSPSHAFRQHPPLGDGNFIGQQQAFYGSLPQHTSAPTSAAAAAASQHAHASASGKTPASFLSGTVGSQPIVASYLGGWPGSEAYQGALPASSNASAPASTSALPPGRPQGSNTLQVPTLQHGPNGGVVHNSQPNSPSHSPGHQHQLVGGGGFNAAQAHLYAQAQHSQMQSVQQHQLGNGFQQLQNQQHAQSQQVQQHGHGPQLTYGNYANGDVGTSVNVAQFGGLGSQHAPIDLTDDQDSQGAAAAAHMAAMQQQIQRQSTPQQYQQHSPLQQHHPHQPQAQQHANQQQHPSQQLHQHSQHHHGQQQYSQAASLPFGSFSGSSIDTFSPASSSSVDKEMFKHIGRQPTGVEVDVVITPRRDVAQAVPFVSSASFADMLQQPLPLQHSYDAYGQFGLHTGPPTSTSSSQPMFDQLHYYQGPDGRPNGHAAPSNVGIGALDPALVSTTSSSAPAGQEVPASALFVELFHLQPEFCHRYPRPSAEIAIASLCDVPASSDARAGGAGPSNGSNNGASTISAEVRPTTPAQRRDVVRKLRSIGNLLFWRTWLDDARGQQGILYSWIRDLVPPKEIEPGREWVYEQYFPDADEFLALLQDLPIQGKDLSGQDAPLVKAMRKLIASKTELTERAKEVSKTWVEKAKSNSETTKLLASADVGSGAKRKSDAHGDSKGGVSNGADRSTDSTGPDRKRARSSKASDSESEEDGKIGSTAAKKLAKANKSGASGAKLSPTLQQASAGDPAGDIKKKKKLASTASLDLVAEKARLKKLLAAVRAKKAGATGASSLLQPKSTTSTTTARPGVTSKMVSTAGKVATAASSSAASKVGASSTLVGAKRSVVPATTVKKVIGKTGTGAAGGIDFFGSTPAPKPRPNPLSAANAKKMAALPTVPKTSSAGFKPTSSGGGAGTSLIMDLLSDERNPKKTGAAGTLGANKRGSGSGKIDAAAKEKKRVRWREEADLVAVKVVERWIDTDSALHDRIMEGGASGLTQQEANMFRSQRAMTEELDWSEPPKLILPEGLPVTGSQSKWAQEAAEGVSALSLAHEPRSQRDGEPELDRGADDVKMEEADEIRTAMDTDKDDNAKTESADGHAANADAVIVAQESTPISPEVKLKELPPEDEAKAAATSKDDHQGSTADAPKEGEVAGKTGDTDTARTASAVESQPGLPVEMEMTIGGEIEPFDFDGTDAQQHGQTESDPSSSTSAPSAVAAAEAAAASAASLEQFGIDFSSIQSLLSSAAPAASSASSSGAPERDHASDASSGNYRGDHPHGPSHPGPHPSEREGYYDPHYGGRPGPGPGPGPGRDYDSYGGYDPHAHMPPQGHPHGYDYDYYRHGGPGHHPPPHDPYGPPGGGYGPADAYRYGDRGGGGGYYGEPDRGPSPPGSGYHRWGGGGGGGGEPPPRSRTGDPRAHRRANGGSGGGGATNTPPRSIGPRSNPRWRTQTCRNWAANIPCPHGAKCAFKHSE